MWIYDIFNSNSQIGLSWNGSDIVFINIPLASHALPASPQGGGAEGALNSGVEEIRRANAPLCWACTVTPQAVGVSAAAFSVELVYD